MIFDKYRGESLDMYELADFLGVSIYDSFFKKHASFFSFFQIQGGYFPLAYLEIYFQYKNLGILMGSTYKKSAELTPIRCCASGSEKRCFNSSLRFRLFQLIDEASKGGGQISEINLWRTIFTSETPCHLKDWVQFKFTLFELLELEQIEISSKDADGKSYRRLNQIKKGPGRPKKY